MKICSTCLRVSALTALAEFTMTAMPSKATVVSFSSPPLALIAAASSGLAGRLAMPICAVLSINAAKPVADPSAAMLNSVPGCCDLNCSASCGTSLAPRVSEPLMTRLSGDATTVPAADTARSARSRFMFV